MPEATEPFALTDEAITDIGRMLQDAALIPLFTDATDREQPAASIFAFCRRLAATSNKNATDLFHVAKALCGLSVARRETDLDGKGFVDQITQALPRDTTSLWDAANNNLWEQYSKQIADALESLNDDHPLFVSSKATSLANTHQNLLLSSRLLTDVRPVFDDAGTKILEMVISHTLALNIHDGRSERQLITITLDMEDILSLKEQCERAERKARIVANKLTGLNPVIWPDHGGEVE